MKYLGDVLWRILLASGRPHIREDVGGEVLPAGRSQILGAGDLGELLPIRRSEILGANGAGELLPVRRSQFFAWLALGEVLPNLMSQFRADVVGMAEVLANRMSQFRADVVGMAEVLAHLASENLLGDAPLTFGDFSERTRNACPESDTGASSALGLCDDCSPVRRIVAASSARAAASSQSAPGRPGLRSVLALAAAVEGRDVRAVAEDARTLARCEEHHVCG